MCIFYDLSFHSFENIEVLLLQMAAMECVLLCDQGKVCVHITNRWKLSVIVGCSFRSTVVPLWEHGQWALSGTELWRYQNSGQGHRLPHRGKAVHTRVSDLTSSQILSWENCLFVLQVEKESVQTTYTENERSMLRYVYDCVFFVARKPADVYYRSPEDNQPAVKSPRRDGEDTQTWQGVRLRAFDRLWIGGGGGRRQGRRSGCRFSCTF